MVMYNCACGFRWAGQFCEADVLESGQFAISQAYLRLSKWVLWLEEPAAVARKERPISCPVQGALPALQGLSGLACAVSVNTRGVKLTRALCVLHKPGIWPTLQGYFGLRSVDISLFRDDSTRPQPPGL